MSWKDNVVYNQSDNKVMVRTDGDLIYVICKSQEEQDSVVKYLSTESCKLEDYEVWEDEKVILTFRVHDGDESELMFRETRRRSLRKSIGWRVIAFSNSWMILSLGLTDIPLYNAIIMNVLGIIYFYLYERLWNKSQSGRYVE